MIVNDRRKPWLLSFPFIYIVCLAFCFQLTDFSLGPVKLWEVFAFLSLFFYKKLDRYFLTSSVYFVSAILFLSFLSVFFSNDEFMRIEGALLKSKYVISLVRAVELFLCVVIVLVSMKVATRIGVHKFTQVFLGANSAIVGFILVVFFVESFFGLENLVSQEGGRLKGGFVEGGPYGLYLSFLALLTLLKWRRITFVFSLFIVALFLSESKAGYVLLTLGLMAITILRVKQLRSYLDPYRKRFLIGVILCCGGGAFLVYSLGGNYVDDLRGVEEQLLVRSTDTNLVMGRVAGVIIGTNMISENPIVGIGIGNYSLLRNNEIYRGFLPSVDGWDLTGLGGVFTLVVENGIFGLLLFVLYCRKIFLGGEGAGETAFLYALLFLLPFLLGAQLYMVYPWLAIALHRASVESNSFRSFRGKSSVRE